MVKIFKTVKDLKMFLENTPEVTDETLVCPVSDHTIRGQHLDYGIVFDNGNSNEIIYDGTQEW